MRHSTRTHWIRSGVAVALVLATAATAAAALSDCHDATCRVTAGDGGRGTGCVFEISQGQVYVLTAAHLVARGDAVECEFWRDGHCSSPLSGRVIARSEPADAAILAVAESEFGGRLPAAIPVAPRGYAVRPGDTLTSVGCANGAWSTGWKGHALGYRGGDLCFTPPPANGRSGSAVFDAAGQQIVGLVRARTADDAEGIATSLETLYESLGDCPDFRGVSRENGTVPLPQRHETGTVPLRPSQTQCPGGACPAPRADAYRYHLLPLPQRNQYERGRADAYNQRRGSAWPTWPTAPAPAAPASPIDLGPTNDRLDRISQLLQELRPLAGDCPDFRGLGRENGTVPFTPDGERRENGTVPLGPALKAAEEAKAEASAAATQAAASQAETGKLRAAVDALIGDRDTLLERFETRLAKVKDELGQDAGRGEVARAYVKDLVEEKLADGTLGLSGGKLLGGALGLSAPLALALAGGLWLVSRRIGAKVESGEPLLVQKLAAQIGDKLDALKDRPATRNPE